MRGTIVFAHANGFPAGTYRQLFALWRAAGWRVRALPMFGHDPGYPVASGWRRLRDQLIDFCVAEAPQGAYLVGHSLGGILALMTACRRPELAQGVVLLDSPLITGWRAHSVQMLKLSGLMARVSPGKVARTRRHEWPSRRDAVAHFGAKSKFARWAPGLVEDYVTAGTVRRGGKAVLAFDRAIETRIYDTLPHDLGPMLRRHPPRCPVAFVAGERSREIRQGGMAATHALVGERLRWIAGTHLFPMEQPALTADLVLQLLQTMQPP
jgi:pimeloyl-ACP methyl ester carboxylesterase